MFPGTEPVSYITGPERIEQFSIPQGDKIRSSDGKKDQDDDRMKGKFSTQSLGRVPEKILDNPEMWGSSPEQKPSDGKRKCHRESPARGKAAASPRGPNIHSAGSR